MPWKALVATLAFAAMLSSLSTGEFNKGLYSLVRSRRLR
jgi:hypothetical protein